METPNEGPPSSSFLPPKLVEVAAYKKVFLIFLITPIIIFKCNIGFFRDLRISTINKFGGINCNEGRTKDYFYQ